jgi:uncharacterized membrane protein
MAISERLVARAIDSKTGKVIEAMRIGWNSYSFIFYIGSISAILGTLFGNVGWLSVIVTIIFFYVVGRFEQKVQKERERRNEKAKHSSKKRQS